MRKGQAALESRTAIARTSHGQAALEFMITYGWAITIILAFVAVIYYLGVINNNAVISRTCTFTPSFTCTSEKLMKNDTLMQLVFTGYNGLGYDIGFDVNTSTITAENLGALGKTTTYGTCSPMVVKKGARYTCLFNITNMTRVPVIGDMNTMRAVVAYHNCDSSDYLTTGNCSTGQLHTIVGNIATQMESITNTLCSGRECEDVLCSNSQCDDNLGETLATCPEDCTPIASSISLVASPSFIYANSSSTTLTATVRDQFGQLMNGTTVNFTENNTYGTLNPSNTTTNGSAATTFTSETGTEAVTILITASSGNESAFRVLRILPP